MKSLDITIKGNPPAKKNQKQVFVKNGKMIVIPSKAHKDWHKDASKTFKMPRGGEFPLKSTHTVTLTFYSPTKRKYDLTNKAETIMDFLVDMGVLSDDNYEVCPCVQLVYGGLKRNAAKTEIEILY